MSRGRLEIGLEPAVERERKPEAPIIYPPPALDPIVVRREIQVALEAKPIADTVARSLKPIIPKRTALERTQERIRAEDDALMELILMELNDE